ncbi:hypothetical protein SS50377_23980 [Spironucleus salmonicida]|uniref:Secreted protein n=1 Tax=Spironucleus salmonicida TaxID=348837 RepID=A0A9P8LTN1_9EUKA|nr:hypothetical protein SS50377_23980 [Spironucleus salmonicida]
MLKLAYLLSVLLDLLPGAVEFAKGAVPPHFLHLAAHHLTVVPVQLLLYHLRLRVADLKLEHLLQAVGEAVELELLAIALRDEVDEGVDEGREGGSVLQMGRADEVDPGDEQVVQVVWEVVQDQRQGRAQGRVGAVHVGNGLRDVFEGHGVSLAVFDQVVVVRYLGLIVVKFDLVGEGVLNQGDSVVKQIVQMVRRGKF